MVLLMVDLPKVIPTADLLDPEDRAINIAINARGFNRRRSISAKKELIAPDFQEVFNAKFGSNILLDSMDVAYDPKTKTNKFYGSIIFDLSDAILVYFRSASDFNYFHFWSDKNKIAEDYCAWVQQNLILDKVQNVFDDKNNTREITFWAAMGGDYEDFNRSVVLYNWDDHVQYNYPPAVAKQLNFLRDLNPPILGGKILIFHGSPGTGKTSFLRCLTRHWTDWCHTSYITDPENFLGQPGAMLRVITWNYQSFIAADVLPENAYHLLILEDADELITTDAKERTGQALSRLLNIGDGLLGHSTNLLICITTNVEVEKLHPAITRNGRCIANIHFDMFTYEESVDWLKANNIEASPHEMGLKHAEKYSLADLYALSSKAKQITHKQEDFAVGIYL